MLIAAAFFADSTSKGCPYASKCATISVERRHSMDLIKIGKYIAQKRKALGLTQKQLAEKLGMSDKSVSKWERGVCLPDVSVYFDLCSTLGITIHEFLAGEDIVEENIVQRSEETILQITADSQQKQNHLRRIIILLAAAVLACMLIAGAAVYYFNRPLNILYPVARDSTEMQTLDLLAGPEGAYMFRYNASEDFSAIKLYISEFQSGKLVNKRHMTFLYEDLPSPESGTFLFVPDFANLSVKLIVANATTQLSTGIPVLNDVPDGNLLTRSATQLQKTAPLRYDEELGLLALLYGDILDPGRIEDYVNGVAPAINDYVYFFSVQFCK